MLGRAVVRRLEQVGANVSATARDESRVGHRHTRFDSFSVGDSGLTTLLRGYGDGDFVVNCIGLIKHRLDDSNERDRLAAIQVNAEFPYRLAHVAEQQGFRIIQIATDCVYSGTTGSYDEESPHDAHDVYGKTKSLGEVPSPQLLNLRCSIIGREIAGARSLVEWLLSQTHGTKIRGYTDHLWNGVTTQCFAEVTAGLVSSNTGLSGTFHLVPEDEMNKNELSALILREFGRLDVTVIPTITGDGIDRTLSTLHPNVNQRLWELGGYATPPSINQMVHALAKQG